MANSAPTISGTTTLTLREGSASTYARSGNLWFSDADTTDQITVGLAGQSVTYRSSAGADLTASLSDAQRASLLQAFTIPGGNLGRNSGSQSWTYTLGDSSLDFLAAGETITVTSVVQASDGNGGIIAQNVVVTLTGTNDAPTIAAVANGDPTITAAVSESAGMTGSGTVSVRTGNIGFSDLDFTDAHTVTVSPKAGGYAGAVSAVVSADSTGGRSGRVDWTYTVADKALDVLAAGQQVTQLYTITVSDGKGGLAKQDIAVVLTGSNDVPTISGGTSAVFSEGSATSYAKSGTVLFSDIDATDQLTTSIVSQSLQWKTSAGVDLTAKLTTDQIFAITKAFSLQLGDLGSNKGSATWSFAVADSALDFLGRLDVLTLTTTVQADDHNGGIVAKPITLTISGINDSPTIEALSPGDTKVTANITETAGTLNSAAVLGTQGTFAFTDLDVNDLHTMSFKPVGAGYIGKFTPTLISDSTGGQAGAISWTYTVADKALDYLAAGQNLTQVYAITIADGKGGTVVQNVTVNMTGVNDSPVLTGIASGATIYEPLVAASGFVISRGGTISIADPDATDRLSVSVGAYQIHYFDVFGNDLSAQPSGSLTDAQRSVIAQVQELGQYLTITPTTSGGAGTVTWSYAIDPAKLSFLGAGESVRLSSDVVVQDVVASGQASGTQVIQPISVTLVGADAATSVKDHVASIVDKSYLATIGSDFSVGSQSAAGSLRPWSALTGQDGVTFRAPITVEITQNGASFDGIDFRGKQVIVKADNVTFTNCYFDTSALIGQSPLTIMAGYANTVVDHSTFDGLKREYSVPDLIVSNGINTTLSNNLILNAPVDGVYIESGRVVGNYIAGGGYFPPGHSDAIWIGKTTGSVVIENNVIDWRTPADARVAPNNAIRISGEAGNVNDVTIRNNVLLGGNYTITVTAGATWTHTADQVGTITNVRIYDNVIDYGVTGSIDPEDRPTDLYIAHNSATTGSGVFFGSEATGAMPNLGQMSVMSGGASPSVVTSFGGAYIIGGLGSDILNAQSGALNVIQGGLGRDFIAGGPGQNIFLYKSIADGNDWIKVFNAATDKIDLSSLVELESQQLHATDWLWLDGGAFTGRAHQITYTYNAALDRTVVAIDINGDLKTDFQIQISGRQTLTQSNFVLEHTDKPASVLGALWSGSGFNLATTTLTLPFNAAEAPLVVRDGVVALQDSDGTLLPISGMGTYVFLDRTVVENDGSPLIDDLWYLASYHVPDVGYTQGGWQAGYDPNPYFSTKGYLALHPDLVSAGLNPLDHWSSFGWQLGYDPSASFDVKSYLLRYATVITPGVDPLTDYITVGKSAGRVAYGAIGDSIAGTGFDPEYYLLAHPDVAASGLDPYSHYLSVGWHEGYNPNAFFNVSYYLAQYPDVAASGADPLQDYLGVGWQAGRNPSADFDGAIYLAMNPDVAASGLNPLVHFLQIGANEGRVAFPVGSVTGDAAPSAANDVATVFSSGLTVSATAGVLANDVDANGDVLSIIAVDHDGFNVGQVVHGRYGDLTMAKDGSYQYVTTTLDGPLGTPLYDTFNYALTDGHGANSSATLTLRVDRAGTAGDDARNLTIHSGEGASVDAAAGVLANDSDPDGALAVVGVGGVPVGSTIQGLYGTLVMAPDGSYAYTRTTDTLPANAQDSFHYTVADGSGQLNSAWLTISLSEPPVVNLYTPTISGTTAGTVIEDAGDAAQTTGTLVYSDGDLGDLLTTSIVGQSVSYADASGGD
ncbi:VCBS domain-containing protein, partial [Methylobacterium sp. Leaf465]|uniref:VCBS domain-containing protein n=1 Tax=Methylobacterium sp. Leaf465 TaxID=1736385 RepID=UPI000A3EB88A